VSGSVLHTDEADHWLGGVESSPESTCALATTTTITLFMLTPCVCASKSQVNPNTISNQFHIKTAANGLFVNLFNKAVSKTERIAGSVQ
jgi:hypothetical protein